MHEAHDVFAIVLYIHCCSWTYLGYYFGPDCVHTEAVRSTVHICKDSDLCESTKIAEIAGSTLPCGQTYRIPSVVFRPLDVQTLRCRWDSWGYTDPVRMLLSS